MAQKLTFARLCEVFADAMAEIFPRWEDEHEYEKDEFKAFFQKYARRVGGTITAVNGGARSLVLTLSVPRVEVPLQVKMTSSGNFTVKAVQR
jgi:hypothetical protein